MICLCLASFWVLTYLPLASAPCDRLGLLSSSAILLRMWSRLRRQVEEAGGIAEDLYALTDDADQLHGQPSNSGWFDGARNGSQLHEFTDAVVGPAAQWYMEYECRDFANDPQGRAVVRIDKMIRADSAGYFCEGVHLAASDDYYSYWANLSCGREDCIYHLCQGYPERCKSRYREEGSHKRGRTVIHVGAWRRVSLKTILDSKYGNEAGLAEFSRRFENYFHPKQVSMRLRDRTDDPSCAGLLAPFKGPVVGGRAKELAKEPSRGSTRGSGSGLDNAVEEALANAARASSALGSVGSSASEVDGLPVSDSSMTEAAKAAAEARPRDLLLFADGLGGGDRPGDRGKSTLPRPEDRSKAELKVERDRRPDRAGELPTAQPDRRDAVDDLLRRRHEEARSHLAAKKAAVREERRARRRHRGSSRSRSRGRRRRRSRSRSCSSVSDDEEAGQLFRDASHRGEVNLMSYSQRHPGRLMRSGFQQMMPYLAARCEAGDGLGNSWDRPRATAYANQILLQQFPESRIGVGNVREVLTVCRCLDFLMAGQLAQLGDTLMQRLKALEASFRDGSWAAAKHADLLPAHIATLQTQEERDQAVRTELRQKKLEQALRKAEPGLG